MKKLLFLVLVVLLVAAIPAFALADGGGAAETALSAILIENAVEITTAFFIALIGAWLTVKLGQKVQLSSINKAPQEVILLVRQSSLSENGSIVSSCPSSAPCFAVV